MVDAAMPSNGAAPPLGTIEELREVWDRFRAGSTVTCPNDGVPLALSVDGSGGVYRFVCTQCGTASAWFEAGPGGMMLRIGPGRGVPAEGGQEA